MNTAIFVNGAAISAVVAVANAAWAYRRVRGLSSREASKQSERQVRTQMLHAVVDSDRGRVDLLTLAPEMEPLIRRVFEEVLANPALTGESITIEPTVPESDDK